MTETEKAIKRLESCSIIPFDEDSQQVCDLAIKALRHQQQRDENKPLTLDELRKMDGEPVYIMLYGHQKGWGSRSAWVISGGFGNHNEFTFAGYSNLWGSMVESNYGKTWLAYRYKPESEANHE